MSNFNVYICASLILKFKVMFKISQVSNYFNYEENVVVTTIYSHNDSDELVSKSVAFDKTPEEMENLVKTWSLTTLSINTEISQNSLINRFGESFKHVQVRFINNRLVYDYDSKLLTIDSLLEASLDSSFENPQLFDLHSESPLPESKDFEKAMFLPNLVGFKKV